MQTQEYPEPVARLITLGETPFHAATDYRALGLRREHIPALIRLLKDEKLRTLPWGEDGSVPPGVYAQVHAWRALTQLDAQEAIPAFLDLLYLIDEEDNAYVSEEIPVMLGRLGKAAAGPCRAYLASDAHGLFARVAAAHALAEIGQQHPEARDACVRALASVLEAYENNDEVLNGFLISYLVDLRAIEHIDLIRRAFDADRVDLMVMGDFEDVQIELGLLDERQPPSPLRPDMLTFVSENIPDKRLAPSRHDREKKEKARRKQARRQRRQNRKRKKKKRKTKRK